MFGDKKKSKPNTRGIDRRAFERRPLDLDAHITVPGSAPIQRKIRDFCVGGMLLVDDKSSQQAGLPATYQLEEGDLIDISFSIDNATASNDEQVSLHARIVRQDVDSSGVALIDPDLGIMQSLMALAKGYRQSQADIADLEPASQANIDMIAECTELVVSSLIPLAIRTHEAIVNALFEGSKSLKDIVEQNLYFETLGILNENKDKLVTSFSQNAIERMACCQNGELNELEADSGFMASEEIELAIVEEEELDNWLADTGTIESVQRTHNEILTQLARRLSELFSTTLNNETNPYGPALFTHSFQDAISAFDLNHKVTLVCHKVFKGLLISALGELYKNLNERLIERGILPDLTYEIPQAETSVEEEFQAHQEQSPEMDDPGGSQSLNNQSAGNQSAGNQSAGNQSAGNQSAGNQSAGNQSAGNQSAGNQSAGGQSSNSQSAGNPADGQSPNNQPAGSPSAGDQVSGSATADMSNHNIYELVAELRTLKRQLREQSPSANDQGQSDNTYSSGDATQTSMSKEGNIAPKGVALTPNEVLQTLTRIESSCTELNRDDFKKLIYSSLTDEVDENGEVKVIAARENQIIDVSNSIFDTMLTDVQVPENMHTWLARMEMPVLKMAIEDDSLFMDRDHLVRQVVNKIAQLGLLIGEEESEGTNSVRTALNWLVDLISSDFDGTLSVFDRVSDQLDILIKAQDKKYDDQLKLVIEEFKSDAYEVDEVVPNVESEFKSESDYEEWLRRAHRLEEGDWILFDLDTPNSKRLRAAWVAHHTNKIVFVDAVGSKDRVIFFEELAALLHSGAAITLDDANEPAMDRAQYSMLQELNEQLVHESTHDQLTGLMNRREFEKQIGKALISSRHSGIRHALLFVDLDQFNIINTTYGYEAGDMLLVEIAKLFSKCQKHSCVLARLGSDEFGLLLEDVGLEDSLEIAEEFIHQAREHKFMWDGNRVSMGTSIGLVSINNQSESITSLMQDAESSCSLAKEMGGNRLQLYRSGQTRFSHRPEVVNWVSKIDDVLDKGRLKLRCQKIQAIDPSSEEMPHYEVLLVMVDDSGESISIQDFIEAAEWGNRIVDIDRWVIKEALTWIGSNKGILDRVHLFSINLSGKSLSDEKLVDYIIENIEEAGVPAEALCFEITETIGVESLSDSSDFINRIKMTGCHFSLDDFGSGMSSYAYLKNLPVDYLKIDGSFIKEMKSSISDYAVVKSICEIGHFMGKRVIAEYVEDDEIFGMLAEIGVDFAQGYGVEKPLMINELLAPH